MKIYFEDGALAFNLLEVDCDFRIDAANGHSFCEKRLRTAKERYPNCAIYTNSLVALDNKFVWNDELKVPELYLRDRTTQKFVRVDELTDRELREGHALMKMYINGAFDNYVAHPYD